MDLESEDLHIDSSCQPRSMAISDSLRYCLSVSKSHLMTTPMLSILSLFLSFNVSALRPSMEDCCSLLHLSTAQPSFPNQVAHDARKFFAHFILEKRVEYFKPTSSNILKMACVPKRQ